MQEDWTTIGESKAEKYHLILSRKKAQRGEAATKPMNEDENENEEDLTGAGKFKKPRFRLAAEFHRLAAYSGMAATRLYVVFIRGLKSR